METHVASPEGDPPDYLKSRLCRWAKAGKIKVNFDGKEIMGKGVWNKRGADVEPMGYLSMKSSSLGQLESINMHQFEGLEFSVVEELFNIAKTIPSLKDFHLRLSQLLGWHETVSKLITKMKTLEKFDLDVADISEDEAKSVVDALLQTQTLQAFNLTIRGGSSSKRLECDVPMEQLCRYLKDPNNVLAHLKIFKEISDMQVQLLAEVLGENKSLTLLHFSRKKSTDHLRSFLPSWGVGRICDALHSNNVLGTLTIQNTHVWVQEMEKLVAALIPLTTSGSQPNSSLKKLSLRGCTVEQFKGAEQLSTLIKQNTSLLELNIEGWEELSIKGGAFANASKNVERLLISLQTNRSLKRLKLGENKGIFGKEVLGMIMDMLLHNPIILEIGLHRTPLMSDGSAEIVHAELRKRIQDYELWLNAAKMPPVTPNSARLFLCGNGEAGKTTLCQKWVELQPQVRRKKRHMLTKLFQNSSSTSTNKAKGGVNERTRGIEVHKMIWEDMNVSIWDLAGQEEYHSFHDLIVPNQSTSGSCSLYFIVCNPNNRHLDTIKAEVHYWLKFIASNTRRSKSYCPHVTVLMTHFDLWQNDLHLSKRLKEMIKDLKSIFKDHLNFDIDSEYFPMDNKNGSLSDAIHLKKIALDYIKILVTKIPKVLKATIDLQSIIAKWNVEHLDQPFISWDTFSKICEEVNELKWSKEVDVSLLKKKQFVAKSLHEGGHIMYYEDIGNVVMNPQWFCHDIMGNILFKCSSLNPNYCMMLNGVIPRTYLEEIFLASIACKQFERYFDDFLSIMMRLQICYEHINDNIMFPSLLKPVGVNNLHWPFRTVEDDLTYSYIGRSLASKEPTATILTAGFFPRLQVYLQKFVSGVAKRSYKLSKDSISFTHHNNDVFIEYKNDRIDIMSRSLNSEGYKLHLDIITAINDLRSSSTLGCSGVDFEEFILRPYCVQELHSYEVRKNQIVSKNELKRMVISFGGLNYQHYWDEDELQGLAGGFDLAETLLDQKEWQDVLQSHFQALDEIDKAMTIKLTRIASTIEAEDLFPGDLVGQTLQSSKVPSEMDELKTFIQNEFYSLHTKLEQHHDEVKSILKGLKKNIIQRQNFLYSKVSSNIGGLMEFSVQLLQSRVPKYPIFVPESSKNMKQVLKQMIPGLTSGRLYFFCEHKDGFHLAPQLGLHASYGTSATRKFGIVLFWGLTVVTMLLKVGAHMGAGIGGIVPEPIFKDFMFMLDTPGLVDIAQPTGRLLEYLPTDLKKNPAISKLDNQVVEDWLIDFIKSKCNTIKSIHEKLGLNKVVYINDNTGSESSHNHPLVAWICDEHLELGKQNATLRPLGNSFSL